MVGNFHAFLIHANLLKYPKATFFGCTIVLNITVIPMSNVCQVKTLKPLSTLKLQQLCGLMKEESFVDGEYIATEGETVDKFYVTIQGNVSDTNKTTTSTCRPGRNSDIYAL